MKYNKNYSGTFAFDFLGFIYCIITLGANTVLAIANNLLKELDILLTVMLAYFKDYN